MSVATSATGTDAGHRSSRNARQNLYRDFIRNLCSQFPYSLRTVLLRRPYLVTDSAGQWAGINLESDFFRDMRHRTSAVWTVAIIVGLIMIDVIWYNHGERIQPFLKGLLIVLTYRIGKYVSDIRLGWCNNLKMSKSNA